MPPKVERGGRPGQQRTESRSNLVGKFTTSVKKFVSEVEFDHTRESATQLSQRLFYMNTRITKSYYTVRNALTTLHEKYEMSKAEKNVVRRYGMFKTMVKDVINLDTQYWLLLDVPKQDKQEQVTNYVLRTCTCLEKAGESRTVDGQPPRNTQEEESLAKERKQRLDAITVKEIEDENTQTINDLYRLLKRYSALKAVVHQLRLSYQDSKVYPFIPRYNMLKDMIKGVLRDPNYMEVCHEDINQYEDEAA
ncbi:uncharacterized protein LOC100898552 [Galendromus occidentalis]|uniref:Uncharacterized protein LOC100898552 n=1 Tax=Galendromus occidentalis TaxID=34638 RepID=A0AAJ6QT58_9ACAR|nr:uncharacterized protein LOC100898552 [Galendromus occidentalis]